MARRKNPNKSARLITHVVNGVRVWDLLSVNYFRERWLESIGWTWVKGQWRWRTEDVDLADDHAERTGLTIERVEKEGRSNSNGTRKQNEHVGVKVNGSNGRNGHNASVDVDSKSLKRGEVLAMVGRWKYRGRVQHGLFVFRGTSGIVVKTEHFHPVEC